MGESRQTAWATRWRFSLQGIFVATAGIAVVLSIFTWATDVDERSLLVVWLACALASLLALQLQFHRAARIGWLMATVLPAAAFWICHVLVYGVWRYGYSPVLNNMTALLAIIMLTCGFATSLAIGGYWLVSRLHGRRRGLALLSLLLAGWASFFVGPGLLQRDISWRPIFAILDIDVSGDRYPYLPIAISDDGRLIALGATPLRDGKEKAWIRLWDTKSGKEITPAGFSPPFAGVLCFSPDGKLLAVVHHGISIYDTDTGHLIRHLGVATGHQWAVRNCRFSPDGDLLVLCTADSQKHGVKVWETRTWALIQENDLQRPTQPVVHDGGIALLSGVATQDVELLDLRTLKAQFPARRLVVHGIPVLSPSGKQVTCGNYLIHLQTGKTKHLAAPAYCLVNGGRWLASRRCDVATFQQGSKLWQLRVALPFVRHWYKSAGGQVVLLDVATGKEICASPAYQNEAFVELIASADGQYVLGASAGKFRVWQVSENE